MCEVLIFRAYAKIFVGFLFVIAGVCSYFLDSLHISFSPAIIDSLLQTNWREASDFMSLSFFAHLVVFVLSPLFVLAILHYFTRQNLTSFQSLKAEIVSKISILLSLAMLLIALYFAQGSKIIEVFKEKRLLFVINPFAPIRASIDFATDKIQLPSHYTFLGQDASTNAKNKIFVLVIGESARAANFQLNGYERQTNPYTSKRENLIYFRDFTSCGVITAISVPCMLSHYPRQSYTNRNLIFYSDSLLDVAKKAGYKVYFLSNNGGECIGGICNRLDTDKVIYFNKNGQFDGDMLEMIESIISNASKDFNTKNNANNANNTLLVVHLQGSHGARYDLRYPKEFERFSPVCDNNELSQCEISHIYNAYDNSLIYSDFVLDSIIAMLEKSRLKDASLWYVSDHGESLGEYRNYMHGGFPYFLAPEVQKQIPSMLWFKQKSHISQNLASKKDNPYSHDFVFHTLLRLLEITTKDYDKDFDMLE